MSNLPQRKKTPEEIAKIRESMGLGGPVSAAAEIAPSTPPAAEPEPPVPSAPAPGSLPGVPAPVPSASTSMPEMPTAEPRPPTEAKPVRSLRKSERGPAPAPKAQPTSAATHLPSQRRSDFEINQLRRTQAFSVQSPATHLIALTVHPAIAGLGYLCVFTAAALPFVDYYLANVSRYVPGALCVAGLGIAGFIFLKKKRSLHHAGFIAAIAILTLTFGALYYFPHLRNAP